MSRSLFAAVELAPRDPILGLNEAFAADPRPQKLTSAWACITTKKGASRCSPR